MRDNGKFFFFNMANDKKKRKQNEKPHPAPKSKDRGAKKLIHFSK